MSNGWYFDNVIKIDVTAKDVQVIDGHIWVSNGTKVTVYNIWGDVDDKKDVERTDWTELTKNDFRAEVKVIEFTVENGAGKLCDAGDKVWITNDVTPESMISVKKDFSNLTGNTLKSDANVIKMPVIMWSDIIYAYGKLWMVSEQVLTDSSGVQSPPQSLYTYNGTWTSTLIPDKPQELDVRLVDGKNGFVYATRYNNVAVAKFASADASFIGLVRTNAEPTSITVADEGILVSSYHGMVSVINPSNDVVTHTYSTLSITRDIVDTGDGYIWAITADGVGFIRVKKADKSVIYTELGFVYTPQHPYTDVEPGDFYQAIDTPGVSGMIQVTKTVPTRIYESTVFPVVPQDDFTFEISDFTGNVVFNKLMATHTFPMQYWNGSSMVTTTAYQRLIFVSNSNVYVIKNNGSLNRKPFAQLGAYGYITTGSHDYAGD